MTIKRYKFPNGQTLNLSDEDAIARRKKGEIFELIGERRFPTTEEYVNATQSDLPEILGAATANPHQKELAKVTDELAETKEELARIKQESTPTPDEPDVQTKQVNADDVKNKARNTK